MATTIPATITALPDDNRTLAVTPLVSPALLRHELGVEDVAARRVLRSRAAVGDVLDGRDDRLLVVVGPCSIHDPAAGLEYARRLAALVETVGDRLLVVMRAYFEKPRSTLGWKGLINDPGLDGTFDVNRGLRTARSFLLDVASLGLPVGCEFLDPITPQYLADVVTWGSIGARTAASQIHRQLVSGLAMPIGIKNGTDGDVGVAIDAARAAGAGHVLMGITQDGLAAVLRTSGNPDCHVVLRGGGGGPNHSAADVDRTLAALAKAGLPPRIVIDASHGNSGKDHVRQAAVARELAERVAAGEPGVVGVMLESFLEAGRQEVGGEMVFGRSVTDSCLDWDTTADLLLELADAVATRRVGAAAVPIGRAA